jgi:hypothetical protein
MIGAGRPPTDEQISQICACQLVSTRLAQAAPNGGSARVLPDTHLSPSVTLTIGIAGESASVQRRLDWSA